MPGKRNKYTAQFKLAVITFAENSNNSAAGREYGVSEKLVRDWKKVSTRLSEMPKKSVLIEAKQRNIQKWKRHLLIGSKKADKMAIWLQGVLFV